MPEERIGGISSLMLLGREHDCSGFLSADLAIASHALGIVLILKTSADGCTG